MSLEFLLSSIFFLKKYSLIDLKLIHLAGSPFHFCLLSQRGPNFFIKLDLEKILYNLKIKFEDFKKRLFFNERFNFMKYLLKINDNFTIEKNAKGKKY